MTDKHTPWTVKFQSIPGIASRHWRIFDSNDDEIAGSPVGLHAFNEDHGILLAAAPEMLEALERALTTTQEIERVTGQRHYNPGTLQKMADAIKAAKGNA